MGKNGRISRASVIIGQNSKFSDLQPGLFCLNNDKDTITLFIKMKPYIPLVANAIRMNGEFVLVPEDEDVFPVTETIEPARPY